MYDFSGKLGRYIFQSLANICYRHKIEQTADLCFNVILMF